MSSSLRVKLWFKKMILNKLPPSEMGAIGEHYMVSKGQWPCEGSLALLTEGRGCLCLLPALSRLKKTDDVPGIRDGRVQDTKVSPSLL